MQRDYWLERWENKKPGFHQQKINSRLIKFWSQMKLDKGRIFVPMCGKSLDMVWFADSGCSVLGVEFSEAACRDFFAENNLPFQQTSDNRFQKFVGEKIELWQGDYFSLRQTDLSGVAGVYDRASLVALPAQMRKEYADHLSGILNARARIFLISMEYDESKMDGPPFSVSEEEVIDLFGEHFSITRIAHSSGPDIVGNLQDRGLDSLDEKIYIMEKS